uniref:Uncharacterized protein n=1 Tax=Romanomermis culicivorax TaxID=13658 RepID=A0A915JHH9_ROMCU
MKIKLSPEFEVWERTVALDLRPSQGVMSKQKASGALDNSSISNDSEIVELVNPLSSDADDDILPPLKMPELLLQQNRHEIWLCVNKGDRKTTKCCLKCHMPQIKNN